MNKDNNKGQRKWQRWRRIVNIVGSLKTSNFQEDNLGRFGFATPKVADGICFRMVLS